jgi:hypothetical protein
VVRRWPPSCGIDGGHKDRSVAVCRDEPLDHVAVRCAIEYQQPGPAMGSQGLSQSLRRISIVLDDRVGKPFGESPDLRLDERRVTAVDPPDELERVVVEVAEVGGQRRFTMTSLSVRNNHSRMCYVRFLR